MNHTEALKREIAARKSQRQAGKVRGRYKYKPYQSPEQKMEAYRNPVARWKPARDGTRRGVPNGMPDRFLRPQSVEQRNKAMKARAGTLQPYASIFKL
jgi:hypothetical protein